MSLLLRPTKCIQYLSKAGSSRGLALPSLGLRSFVLCNKRSDKSFTRWSRSFSSERSYSLQPLLSRLDEEVRRFGRITKKDIQELLIGMRTYDFTSAQSLLVIRCCGELVPEEIPERRTQLVQQVWAALNDRNLPLDISHYNALLRVYIENEHPFSPAEFLEELEKKGIQPNRVTYQRLMWRYCAEGDIEGATRILEKMRELGLPVSEPVLNALVMGHAYHGDPGGARAVLDTMTGAGLQPSGRTYALLAGGHARAGDLDGTTAALKLAAERDIYVSDKDLMEVVESLALGGRADALSVILDMMQKGAGYNQEALNLILRLVNRGLDEAAIQVLKTLTESKTLDGKEPSRFRGAFFVKQLVAAGRPVDQLITLCERLQHEELVPAALTIATGAILHGTDALSARPLLSKMRQEGLPVRHHYYWPLLVSAGRSGDEEALLDVLRCMAVEQIVPNVETLHHYVAPYLLANNDPDAAILKLQAVDVAAPRAARSVLLELLNAGEAREAARIAAQYRPTGYIPMLQAPLLSCLAKTKDIESFVKVLHVALGTAATPDDAEPDAERERDRRGEIGSVASGAIRLLKDVEKIDQLLGTLLERGVGFTSRTAQRIEDYLGERMTAGITEKLAKLSSSDLEPAPAERADRARASGRPQPALLEKALARAREQARPTANIIRQLLLAYIDSEDEAKLTSFLKQLEEEQFVLTGGTLVRLVEFYSERDVETAMRYQRLLADREPDFLLSKYKVVKLAMGLVLADRLQEALQVLSAPKQDKENDTYVYNSLCWRLLNHLAENKQKNDVETFLEAMVSNGFTQPTNALLGALVKTHVLRDDIDGALAELERCCQKYRCTPWKGELMRRLIESEDAARLQRLTDVSTGVHGEVNSLHDLVLALVECGRLRQARRVLETPGLRSRTTRLNYAAQRYMQEGKTDYLEGLMEATKELSHIDRSDIFYNLLVSYCRAGATDKALGLWTQLQEQDEVPTERFLTHLADHLHAQNLPVPFAVTEKRTVPVPDEPKKAKTAQTKEPVKPTPHPLVDELRSATSSGDTDLISKIVEKIKGTDMSNGQYQTVTKLLMDKKLLSEAVSILEAAHARGRTLGARLTRVLLARCADHGQIDLVNRIGLQLGDELRRTLRFDSKVTRAQLAAGEGLAHLCALRDALASASDELQARAAASAFPRGTVLATALRDPQIKQICDEIVEVAVEKGVTLPAHTMWQELLIAGQHAEADALWEKQVKSSPELLYRRVLRHAEDARDTALLRTLLSHVRRHPGATPASLAAVYSVLLRVEPEPAVAARDVRDALHDGLQLTQLDAPALALQKKRALASGVDFPYEIPAAAPDTPASAAARV